MWTHLIEAAMKLKRVREHGAFSNSFKHPWVDAGHCISTPPTPTTNNKKKKSLFHFKTTVLHLTHSRQNLHQVDKSKEI